MLVSEAPWGKAPRTASSGAGSRLSIGGSSSIALSAAPVSGAGIDGGARNAATGTTRSASARYCAMYEATSPPPDKPKTLTSSPSPLAMFIAWSPYAATSSALRLPRGSRRSGTCPWWGARGTYTV